MKSSKLLLEFKNYIKGKMSGALRTGNTTMPTITSETMIGTKRKRIKELKQSMRLEPKNLLHESLNMNIRFFATTFSAKNYS